jgi:hypothetical protein
MADAQVPALREDGKKNNFSDDVHHFAGDVHQFADDANKIMQTFRDGGKDFKEVVTSLIEYKRVEQVTKAEVKKYEAMIHAIDIYRDAFTQLFGQRQQAINKYFEVIDKGMVENNMELITQGLSNLSFLVASSPFKDIGALRNAIESGDKIIL